MTQVWVTRSEPGATEFASALLASGFEPILEPMIKIRATDERRPMQIVRLAVFLSSHAVRIACMGGWKPRVAIAIGPSTAATLAQYDIRAEVPEVHDSEGILTLLKENFLDHDEVTIVCGKNSRSFLRDSLLDEQKSVREWQVYERYANNSQTPIDLRLGDWIYAASREGIEAVSNVWNSRCSLKKSKVNVVVPSHRIARSTQDLGFSNVHVSSGASIDATLSTLRVVGMT